MRSRLAISLLALVACSGGRGVRDVGERRPRETASVEGSDGGATPAGTTTVHSSSPPVPATAKPRVLARVNAVALATTPTHVYLGDAEDDWLFALPKKGATDPVRVAPHAPVKGALVADQTSLAWIATPGDVVFRMPISAGASATTIREKEIFTHLAAQGGDVFLVGAAAGGGALTRITGSTAARLASFDAVPRTVMVDATNVFVVTTTSVLRTPRQRGAVVTLATGTRFGAATSDEACVYVTTMRGSSRAILRVPKYGGATTVTSTIDGVRDAPIAVRGGEIFFFDESRPALRAHRIDTNATRIVAEDPMLERVSALAIDDDGAYVATGESSAAAVLLVPFR